MNVTVYVGDVRASRVAVVFLCRRRSSRCMLGLYTVVAVDLVALDVEAVQVVHLVYDTWKARQTIVAEIENA